MCNNLSLLSSLRRAFFRNAERKNGECCMESLARGEESVMIHMPKCEDTLNASDMTTTGRLAEDDCVFAVTLDNNHQDHHSQQLSILSRRFLTFAFSTQHFAWYIYICIFVLETSWSHLSATVLSPGDFIDESLDTTLHCSASKSRLVPSPTFRFSLEDRPHSLPALIHRGNFHSRP